jgi:hypothetical protein
LAHLLNQRATADLAATPISSKLQPRRQKAATVHQLQRKLAKTAGSFLFNSNTAKFGYPFGDFLIELQPAHG